MRSFPARQSGFTLVEVIVVLAVVLMLSGIAVPLISGYVEDGKRARAEAEIKVLAAALSSIFKDVGIFPSRNSSGANGTLRCLYSGPTVPGATTFNASSEHDFYTWAASGTHGDSLDNQLLHNKPQGNSVAGPWPTTGNMRWRGPYLAGSSPLDPWGRPYLVNTYSTFDTDATNNKRMFVLSAGPDGKIDTSETAQATDDIAGDDIGLILYQRP